MNVVELPSGLVVLDAGRRTYAALSRDESYWHLISPASDETARAFDYVDADGLTVQPIKAGDLLCTCAGGRFKRHCYRLAQAAAYEQSQADEARWGLEPVGAAR